MRSEDDKSKMDLEKGQRKREELRRNVKKGGAGEIRDGLSLGGRRI